MLRYLAALGPASAMDMQSWCGLTRLREVADRLRPQLRVFHDEDGRELLDVPDGPRPSAHDMPAPPRFLPEYDNVLLGHADRSRFFRPGVSAPDPQGVNSIQGSLLVGGLLAAWWNLRRPSPGTAALVIRPFWTLPDDDAATVVDEAGRLAAWAAPEQEREVVLLPVG
jgi:Winged helix DNA-binding domain